MTAAARIAWTARPADGGDPLDLLRRTTDEAMYVVHPARGVEHAAIGAAAAIDACGTRRFVAARHAAATLFARIDADAPVPPMLLGGFAFHDDHEPVGAWRGFPSLRLVLPRVVIARRGREAWCIEAGGECASGAALGSEAPVRMPEPEDWDVRVRRVLADIAAGRLAKLVLSRARDVAAAEVDPLALVRHLRAARPACTTFLVRRGGVAFVGSTPETLVSVRRGVAETVALAGSMALGPAETVDAAALRLLACGKNAAEHRYVANAVHTGLVRVSDAVETTASRAVVRVPEMLHLATAYRARLRPGVSALAAAAALHPTPAVGGVPADVARRRLAAEEPDRGWYTGGVGWIDASGDGDFAVALRCALVRPGDVRLFAGAGIVAGSRPEAEWNETEAKMTAMLRLIEERARAA